MVTLKLYYAYAKLKLWKVKAVDDHDKRSKMDCKKWIPLVWAPYAKHVSSGAFSFELLLLYYIQTLIRRLLRGDLQIQTHSNYQKPNILTCKVLTWSGVPPVPLTVLFRAAGLFPAAFSLDAIFAFSASMRFGLLSITWTTAYSTSEAKPNSRQAMSQMSIALT